VESFVDIGWLDVYVYVFFLLLCLLLNVREIGLLSIIYQSNFIIYIKNVNDLMIKKARQKQNLDA